MHDYEELHDKWKKAKNGAKSVYDGWAKLHMKVSVGDVEINVPAWPKFNMDLGPSLVKMQKNKDFDKSKTKALKAVKQYKTDIKKFVELAEKVAKIENPSEIKYKEALLKLLGDLEKVRAEINDALDK